MGHILLFRLGDAPYALEVEQVQEIIESPQLHFIPRAPTAIIGAINVHGNVFPVLDLVTHLGYAAGVRDHRYIVLAAEVCRLALAVSAVGRIVPGDPEDFLPHPERREKDSCSRGQFEREGELVHLLDFSQLMTTLSPL